MPTDYSIVETDKYATEVLRNEKGNPRSFIFPDTAKPPMYLFGLYGVAVSSEPSDRNYPDRRVSVFLVRA
jgi:hypothetical protein